MTRAMDAAGYDQGWSQWSDFIRYHPGARHRRRMIVEALQTLPAFSQALDVGCGDGQLLDLIAERFPAAQDLSGADYSPQVVERNRQRWPQRRFEVLDLCAGPLPERFELVTCSEVIEHLDDRPAAMQHLGAMTRPGGHLLLTCPTGKLHETERVFGHVHHPTLAELQAWAAPAGLELARSANWGFPLYRALKWATNLRPHAALKHFAEGSYGLPQKLVSRALYRLLFLGAEDSRHGCQLVTLWRQRG